MGENSDNWIASAEAESFDRELAFWDCLASEAHVLMLRKQKIISNHDSREALRALSEIREICARGEFHYLPGLGAQLTLEQMIVDRVGREIGYQVHTGRSRNDQVLVAQKLYVRDQVLRLMDNLLDLLEGFLQIAEAGKEVIMPGYTHMQPARPTTLGQWAAAYGDMFFRDLERLRDAYERNNTSPLGAADSHGTSWNLDRHYTSELLGFQKVHEIPLDVISSRGESDADFLSSMNFIALHLSKLAQDLILFNTYEYGYLSLGKDQAERMGKLTGSSIMPQKKNPDVLELLRAQASESYSQSLHALDLLRGLPTGYNRDSRETKAPIIRGLRNMSEGLGQARALLPSLQFHEKRMEQMARENYSMAPDLAEFLAQKYRVPFREMHGIVGRVVDEAIGEGRLLEDISADEIKAAASLQGYDLDVGVEDVSQGTDIYQAIERRDNIGGSSRGRMDDILERRRGLWGEYSHWLQEERSRIAAAFHRVESREEL